VYNTGKLCFNKGTLHIEQPATRIKPEVLLKRQFPVTGSQCQVFLPSKHTIYVKYEVKVSYLKTFTNKTITNLDRSKRAFRSMLECTFLSIRPFTKWSSMETIQHVFMLSY